MTSPNFIKYCSKKFNVPQKYLKYYLDILEVGLKTYCYQMTKEDKVCVLDLTFRRRTIKEHHGMDIYNHIPVIVPKREKVGITLSNDWMRLLNPPEGNEDSQNDTACDHSEAGESK